MTNNPGTFIVLPWNKFTYEKEVVEADPNTPVDTTIAEVVEQIRTRLQFAADAQIRVKVSNASIWNTAGSNLALPFITGSFYNLSTQNVSPYPRAQLNDSGTLNAPAKMMFKWPVTDKTTILDSLLPNSRPILSHSKARAGSNTTVRINVWYQTGATQ